MDRILYDTGTVRIGAFRCHPDDPAFQNSGPAQNFCFVFPRTAVQIQHEHEPAFVANPNVVTFYNSGQAYLRDPISPQGDHCDWFGVAPELVRDAVRAMDPEVDARPEQPFRLTRGCVDSSTYLAQRRLFSRVAAAALPIEPLAVEETIVGLLERVVRLAYRASPGCSGPIDPRHRGTVHEIEAILSRGPEQQLTLAGIACEVGLSAYHVCRLFHRVTGTKLHQYRLRLRLRSALVDLADSTRALTDVALDAGFSSHSHFTEAFRREFGAAPSLTRRAIF